MELSAQAKARLAKQKADRRAAESEYLAAAKKRFRVQVGNPAELKDAQSAIGKATRKMRNAHGSDADALMLELSRRAMHESREVTA